MKFDQKWSLSAGKVVEDVLFFFSFGTKYRYEQYVNSFILDLSDEELRREFTKEEIQENVRLKPHPQFHNDIKLAICQFLPKYQESIKNLKKNGFEVVGYARKSPSNDKNENRLKLLQKMVDNLENRSLTTRIYVSFSSCASTPFSERDTTTSKSAIASLRNVNGDTQDMLQYLQSADHDICLVSIDYAGLTSRSQELKRLLENNDKIKKKLQLIFLLWTMKSTYLIQSF